MSSQNSGYFLYHSIGQYPGKSADLAAAMADFAAVWGAANDKQWEYLLGQRAEFIDLWRQLIGAGEKTVTTCENVTQGLHMLVTALPENYLRGRKVLVAADCFPSNHFLLTGLQEKLGFTLETVKLRQGASWVEDEDMIARWDRDVALALVTWVSSTSSRKADVEALAAHGRTMGSLVGVDITQAAGLLPFSVVSPEVDFVVSTSLKWMCGTPGAGMLYVRPELIADCRPQLRGWFSQDNPFNWDIERFDYAPDIRRFDNGTPSIVSAAATLPALRWHAGLDKADVLARNRELTGKLIAAADELRLGLVTPRDEKERGGSVMLKLASADAALQMLSRLREQDLYADSRGPVLRLSPGVMTSSQATDELISMLATL
ncbi:MAG: aminotransferase class V-fold PLP-dependent enzyme [Brucellaceae bacterium]|nr:aminotransferase class V-fold PLP-dependent enzyme [Brucellaceae bacterium]